MSETLGLVSIIMAAYNAADTLPTAVESVLAQTYADFELLIVDDCSSDSTRAVAQRFRTQDSRVRLLCNEQNVGVSRTRRRGLEAARGEWIAILDSDDAWRPDKLEKQAALQQRTGAPLLYTGSAFMDADGRPMDWVLHVPATLNYRQLLKQNLLSNSSALVRRDLYERYSVINDDLHEDFATWLQILHSGCTACGVDEPLLLYRIARTSKSGNKLRSAVMNWNTYRFTGLNPLQAAYYEIWYMVKGVLKYRNLK